MESRSLGEVASQPSARPVGIQSGEALPGGSAACAAVVGDHDGQSWFFVKAQRIVCHGLSFGANAVDAVSVLICRPWGRRFSAASRAACPGGIWWSCVAWGPFSPIGVGDRCSGWVNETP